MKLKETSKVLQVKGLIQSISKKEKIHPQQVTKSMLTDEGVSDWTFKTIGGLQRIKDAYFPVQGKDLKQIHVVKKEASYVRKLEAELGKKLNAEEEFKKHLEKFVLPRPKKVKFTTQKKTKQTRVVVGQLNDTHVGLVVDPEEVGNANAFDFKEAGRRFAYYVKEVAMYKFYARKEVQKLHLILNGDLLAGLIHSLDTKSVHLMIHQMNGALHIFTHMIEYLVNYYPEIEIHGLAGNHDRSTHKNHGARAVNEVYDSYANIIFYGLSTVFRNYDTIKFNFPKTPYGFIDLPAGRMMFCHGDHIFSKYLGNPGTSINVKGLSTAIKDFNAGEIAKGNKPIKLVMFAHVHTFAHFITNDGVEVYISPSLVGLDAYAHSLSINNNFIAQPVFESTDKFILGDSRLIRLNGADNDTSLDKIIPTYNKELKWRKS